MSFKLRRADWLDMKDLANISDRRPPADAAPRPASVPRDQWPPGFLNSEARVLAAFATRDGRATVADVLCRCGRTDSEAVRATLRQLEDRGLVVRLDDLGNEWHATIPTGRALARALAIQRAAQRADSGGPQ